MAEKPKATLRQRRLTLNDKLIKKPKTNGEAKLIERIFKEYGVTPSKAQHRAMTILPELLRIAEKQRQFETDIVASQNALSTTSEYMKVQELEDDIKSDKTQIELLKQAVNKTEIRKILFELLFDQYGNITNFHKKLILALEQYKAKLLPGTTLLLTLFSYQMELASLNPANPELRKINDLLREIGKEESPKQGELF